MRTFIEEYGGVIIETIGAAFTIALVISIMQPGSLLNDFMLSFFESLKP